MHFGFGGEHPKETQAVEHKTPEQPKDEVLKQQFEVVQAHLTQAPGAQVNPAEMHMGTVPMSTQGEVQNPPAPQITGGENTYESGPHPSPAINETNYATTPFGEPDFSKPLQQDAVVSERPAGMGPSQVTHSEVVGTTSLPDTVIAETPSFNTHEKLVGDTTMPSLSGPSIEVRDETQVESTHSNEKDLMDRLSPESKKWIAIVDEKIKDMKEKKAKLEEELKQFDDHIALEVEAREAFLDPKVDIVVDYMNKNKGKEGDKPESDMSPTPENEEHVPDSNDSVSHA